MVGKASLIVIVGFSVLFGFAGQYWNRTSNAAVDNFTEYYAQSVARQLAEDAANLACDSVFVNVLDTAMTLTYQDGPNTCQIRSRQRIVSGRKNCFITAISFCREGPRTISDTIEVWLQPMFLNGFAMFSQNENNVYFVTGDTVTGPFATNGQLFIDGGPVFRGRASAVGGIVAGSGGNHAQFLGGFASGSAVHVDIPSDLSGTVAGAIPASTFQQTNASWTGSNYTYDVYLNFNSDGTVTITTKTQKYTPPTYYTPATWTTLQTTAAVTDTLSRLVNSSGETVILVKNGDVHVQGTLNGNVTVVAQAGSGTTANRSSTTQSVRSGYTQYFNSTTSGNVIVEGNMVYNDRTESSTDMLGLVADNSVGLKKQTAVGNVSIDAAIFARNGSWTYLDYTGLSGYTAMGYLNITGSIFQNVRGAVGLESGGTLVTGYLKNYRFDPRFRNAAPPFFPVNQAQYQLVSWYEP